MAASVTVKGLDPLMRALVAAGPDAQLYAEKALSEEAQEAFILSQARVPVRFGILKGSGVVHPPETRGTVSRVGITYGGAAAGYAVYVHELPYRHDAPTAWKYLENPVTLYAQGMGARMATRVADMVARRFQ